MINRAIKLNYMRCTQWVKCGGTQMHAFSNSAKVICLQVPCREFFAVNGSWQRACVSKQHLKCERKLKNRYAVSLTSEVRWTIQKKSHHSSHVTTCYWQILFLKNFVRILTKQYTCSGESDISAKKNALSLVQRQTKIHKAESNGVVRGRMSWRPNRPTK
jgi:hypothetical protein